MRTRLTPNLAVRLFSAVNHRLPVGPIQLLPPARCSACCSTLGIPPIAALFWPAVLNGFLAPPLLVLVMLVAHDRGIMGQTANGRWLNGLGWARPSRCSLQPLA